MEPKMIVVADDLFHPSIPLVAHSQANAHTNPFSPLDLLPKDNVD